MDFLNNAKQVMSIFQQLDRNGDGNITEDDFVVMADNLGLGQVGGFAIRQAFRQIDKNKNGKLDFEEVLGALKYLQHFTQQSHQGMNTY